MRGARAAFCGGEDRDECFQEKKSDEKNAKWKVAVFLRARHSDLARGTSRRNSRRRRTRHHDAPTRAS
jgi:hypothetical protein